MQSERNSEMAKLLETGICDTHHHIYNPKEFKMAPLPTFPWTDEMPGHPAEEYKEIQKKAGITRNVIVACSVYGFDIRSDLDALVKLGSEDTRIISLLTSDYSDEELADLHEKGVRGSRAFGFIPNGFEEARKLAPRFAELGWSLDFMPNTEEQTRELNDWVTKLPCQVVIDHQASAKSVDDPIFKELNRLMKSENVWVKSSGLFRVSEGDKWKDALEVSHSLIRDYPDRVIWGTDWPFNWSPLSEKYNTDKDEYDAGLIFRMLPEQVDEKARQKVLWDNPDRLYFQ